MPEAADFPDLAAIRARWETIERDTQAFVAGLERKLRSGELARTFDDVAEGVIDPYSAAEMILARPDLLRSP